MADPSGGRAISRRVVFLPQEIHPVGSGVEAIFMDRGASRRRVMPRMGGLELLRGARAAGLHTPFVFASGYSVESLEAAEDGRVKLLTKPWMPAQLSRVLADMVVEEKSSLGN